MFGNILFRIHQEDRVTFNCFNYRVEWYRVDWYRVDWYRVDWYRVVWNRVECYETILIIELLHLTQAISNSISTSIIAKNSWKKANKPL